MGGRQIRDYSLSRSLQEHRLKSAYLKEEGPHVLKLKALFALPLVAGMCMAAGPKIIATTIDGVVHPVTAEIVTHAIGLAEEQGAAAVLIRLNTPGGLLDATRQINERITASRVPVITFVTPSGGRAASAGFIILQAGDIAAMSSGTNTGAASPVLMNGEMDKVMRAKAENDLAASLRALVSKRGRNAEKAESAVRSASSFTDTEALQLHLSDLSVRDESELLAKLDGREVKRFDGSIQKLDLKGAQIVEYQRTLRERIVSATSDPNLAFILLALGALGIYAEFSSPGLIAPGVFGGILVLLGLNGLSVMPINWMGAGMMILGVTFFVLEAKYTSHGVFGVGGALALAIGAMVLIDAPPEFRIRPVTAIGVTLPFAVITLFLVTLAVRARANKVMTGTQGMLSEIGVAFTPLAPLGKVFVHGEYWDAQSSAPVEKGASVRVVAVEGMLLKVEPKAVAGESR
jgi:membrane-bound serine protease (ClpP class)